MLKDLNFKLDSKEAGNIILHLLVQNLAAQMATSKTLIEMISKSDSEADQFTAVWNDQYEKCAVEVSNHLYESFGKINPDDFLKK